MKSNLIICSLLVLTNFFIAETAFANNMSPIKIIPKVIYGTDDREDIYESSDSLMKGLARSTAALIGNDKLITNGDNFTIKAETLHDFGVCSTERFAKQLVAADCSGFLISADTLVTAGHCITKMSDCQENAWVFDYANTTEEKKSFTMSKNEVYHCTQIINRSQDSKTMDDFALVKLDRPVTGRAPLKMRTSGKISSDAVLTVIGHPTGLPTKITSSAEIRDNANPVYIRINSDTYSGNSGSVVVDSKTGIVEGILVRGDQDYTRGAGSSCLISVIRSPSGGRGEDVTRITNIGTLIKE